MENPSWAFECPVFFPGMTPRDYLYLIWFAKVNRKGDIFTKIIEYKIELPPVEDRTKAIVFSVFGADVNYVFDEKML